MVYLSIGIKSKTAERQCSIWRRHSAHVRRSGRLPPNPGFDVFDRVPIKRRVQGPGAITEMRRCQNIREMAERMLGRQRFDIEHVQARSSDFARLQVFEESRLNDDGAACRIDEIGRRLHRRKLASSNDATASMAENEMDGDDIRFSKYLFFGH